ncbi:MAG: hypothetical protein HQL49_13260, partial [Gammaproteobacteria bacterium]|nr:hypothetical protein [Gammaproteobacteria bacterium]
TGTTGDTATDNPATDNSATDSSDSTTLVAEIPLPVTYTQLKSQTVTADGGAHVIDEQLSVAPAVTTIPEGAGLVVSSFQASGEAIDSLSQDYTVKSPFYKVAVSGDNDSVGRVELRFASSSSSDRIAMIIDGVMGGLLPMEPVDGVLTLRTPAAPENGLQDTTTSVIGNGDVSYAVVAAKGTAAKRSRTPVYEGFTAAPHDCSWKNCRANSEQVQVYWHNGLGLTASDADKVVALVEAHLTTLKGKGITAADIDPAKDKPISVLMNSENGVPNYDVFGNSIVPASDIKNFISSASVKAKGTILHEVNHQLQDATYNMTWASKFASGRWWMETSAENMLYLVSSDYAESNIVEYANKTTGSSGVAGNFGWQLAPYAWPGDEAYYIHAELLRFNICDNSSLCPLSASSFVTALNGGQFPFDSSSATTQLTNNLHDYSRHLLGLEAISGTMASPTAKLLSGIGDVVTATNNTKTEELDFNLGSAEEPRVKKESLNGVQGVTITTSVEADAVYPLQVNNSGDTPSRSAWPVAVTVEAGSAPVRYRTDGSTDTTYYGDGKAFTIQPISKKLGGFGEVRLAAIGLERETKPFKARIEPVDLSGDWVITKATLISSSVVSSNPEDEINPQDILDNIVKSSSDMALRGAYQRTDNLFTYEDTSGINLGYLFEGSNRMTGSAIETNSLVTFQPIEGSQKRSPGDRFKIGFKLASSDAEDFELSHLALAGLILPLITVAAWRRRRDLWVLLLVLAIAASLQSCGFGLVITGSQQNSGKFNKLSYIGIDGNESAPLWRLSEGEASSDIDVTITSVTTDDKGVEQSVTNTIKGRLTYSLEVEIYKDGTYVDPTATDDAG